MKRSPIARDPSYRLTRSVPLARGEARLARAPRDRASAGRVPASRGAARAALAEVLACRATVAEAARIYGCSRAALEKACREAFRHAVMKRDGWMCQNCPALADDVQHRIRRGMGGTSDPRIAFGMCNGVALCRRCHDRCERKRDAEMHAHGFWLETAQDPAAEPVVALTASGRVRHWPLADGTYSLTSPAGRAA